MSTADTIFALSSGAPPAAIAVIRISGPSAFKAVQILAGRLPHPRRASLVTLKTLQGDDLDRALAMVFPGPNSASGEDLAELHLHGGRAVVRAVESALASISGLRKAAAGEFTRRAFLNGRLDLNEAEGLADLLAAETEWQRRAAGAMMGGRFSAKVEEWRMDILQLSASTEAELDFSDESDVEEQNNVTISICCKHLHDSIKKLVDAPAAEKLRDGLRVVLAGPPNSGKSTLLNALVGRDAAIVSDIAGTTRDVIEIPVAIEGVPLVFIDTAGLRDGSNDQIEILGIERTCLMLKSADIILWLGEENGGPIHPQLVEIDAKIDSLEHQPKSPAAIPVSALNGDGIVRLITEVVNRAKSLLPAMDQFAVNQRQRMLLADAAFELREASASDDWLIVAEHLRLARLSLDALTGRAQTEDMLDLLFSRFCVGK
jgi:tRNA modification GTPase